MESKLNQIILDQFESLEARLNGSKSLPMHEVRKEAIESLKENGLPGNKNEEYKFTRLTSFLEKNLDFNLSNTKASILKNDIESSLMKGVEGSTLVFINDQLSSEFTSIDPDHEDILIKELKESGEINSNGFDHYFRKNQSFSEDGFLAWNTALTEDGIHIQVSKNKESSKPIILYFFSDAQAQQVINKPRVLIDLGENSEVTFIENIITIGDHISFNNSVVEIIAEKATRGSYIKIQNDTDNSVQINTTQVYQPDNSTFSCYTFTLSGKMVRNNLNFVIDGEGAEANMYGLYMIKGATHVDNHTTVDHLKPNSGSNELYKGIMNEQSRGVFNGKIFVRQAAQKTNAFQANNNILLSNDATINTKPQLEIWADDVKCSHGCTTGQLDDEQVFYLRSRGIDKDSALNILLHAFAGDVLNRLPLESVREILDEAITERLK